MGSELILECPYDSTTGGHPFITRTYQIVNNTGNPRNSYNFKLELNDEQFAVGTSESDFSETTNFAGITTFSGRHVHVDFRSRCLQPNPSHSTPVRQL